MKVDFTQDWHSKKVKDIKNPWNNQSNASINVKRITNIKSGMKWEKYTLE